MCDNKRADSLQPGLGCIGTADCCYSGHTLVADSWANMAFASIAGSLHQCWGVQHQGNSGTLLAGCRFPGIAETICERTQSVFLIVMSIGGLILE